MRFAHPLRSATLLSSTVKRYAVTLPRVEKEIALLTERTAREYSAHIHGAMGTPVRTPFNNVMQQFRFSFFGFAWFFTDPGRRSAS